MTKALGLLTLLTLAACRDPRTDANFAQAMIEVGTSINSLQQDQSVVYDQLDSLREVVARQDTAIRRLAEHVGFPLMPR